MLAAVPVLLAVALAAPPGPGGDELAYLPLPRVRDLVEHALPPPPTTVELKTSYFGTVTLDHQAHLARRIHCKDCHIGRIGPIEFTPREAHDRCRSCHVERKAGPTDCRGCHAVPPPATQAAEAPAAPTAAEPPSPEAAAPGAAPPAAARGAIADVQEEVRLAEPPPPVPFLRSFQVGGVAGTGAGLSVRVALRRDAFVVSQGLDRLGGWGRSRTLVTAGVGASLPLEGVESLRMEADGLGGLDVTSGPGPDVYAAVGARVGVAWAPPWTRRLPLFLSLSALVDLFHGGVASPACAYATIGVGTRPAER